jgi:uncharacterized FAD-dependent dehydrogenase
MRLTELRLPLDHSDADLRAAIVKRLGIAADELLGYSVFRRGYDARKRSAIVLTYTLDVTLRDEAAVLARLAGRQPRRPDARHLPTVSSPARHRRRRNRARW